jgi:hypothetical protein
MDVLFLAPALFFLAVLLLAAFSLRGEQREAVPVRARANRPRR